MRPINKAWHKPACFRPAVAVSRYGHMGTVILAAMVALSSLIVVSTMTGCKDTDVIKEIVYDQDADIEETNTDQFVWKYDADSDTITDQLPESQLQEATSVTNNCIPRALYSSSANDPSSIASQFLYADPADYDCESTGYVTYIADPDAPENDNAQQQIDQTSDEISEDQGLNGDTDENVSADGTTLSDSSDNFKDLGAGQGAGGGGSVPVNAPGNAGSGGTNAGGASGGKDKPKKSYNSSSQYDIPKLSTVAAYGSVAVTVDMLTGGGALVGANADLINGVDGVDGGFQAVFGSEGASGVQCVWNDTAQSSKRIQSSTQADVAALIALHPDAVLITDTDAGFTDAQTEQLSDAGISIVQVHMGTDYNISCTISYLAQALEGSTAKASGIDPQTIAQNYETLHDKVIQRIEQANGGYSAYDDQVLDDEADDSVASGDSKCTLLIDDWNTSCIYNGSWNGYTVQAHNGVGLATAGWQSSPASYYMGVGGLVNTAAAAETWTMNQTNKAVVVWQFGYNELDPNAWSVNPGITLDRSGGAVHLLSTLSGSGRDDISSKKDGFGSDSFPNLIVANQDMKDSFVSDASHEGGLYYPYPVATTSGGQTFVGKICASQPLYCDIGRCNSGQMSTLAGASSDTIADKILVNPCGLCGSWIDGSPESVLESAWVANVMDCSAESQSQLNTDIKDFYKTCYRYDLSDDQVNDILAGSQSGKVK